MLDIIVRLLILVEIKENSTINKMATKIFYSTRQRHTATASRESNPLPYTQQRDYSQRAKHWTTGALKY